MLSAEDTDWAAWWPGRYVQVEKYTKGDKAQMWYMTPEGYLYNQESGPQYTLANDWGLAMLAKINPNNSKNSSFFPKQRRAWFYDAINGDLTCDMPNQNWVIEDKNTIYNRNALGVFDQLKDGQ